MGSITRSSPTRRPEDYRSRRLGGSRRIPIRRGAFPGRFAPFALMNRAPPNRLGRRLVGYLHPEWLEENNYGFVAFYDRCYFSEVKDLLARNGFTNTNFNLLYYQSIYFNFFYPYLWRSGLMI